MLRFLLPILLSFGLLGASCAQQRIDGSSEEAFEISYQRVRGSLEPDEREEFEEAVRTIGVADLEHHDPGKGSDAAALSIMSRLDGKTAVEILREARMLAARRED